jgi:hypothetical protein
LLRNPPAGCPAGGKPQNRHKHAFQIKSKRNIATLVFITHQENCMTMSMMEIETTLKQLRLSGVRATLETRLLESQASNLTFIETFSAILQDELDRRQSRLLERRYQLSGLDERASLAEFDWGYNPKIPSPNISQE